MAEILTVTINPALDVSASTAQVRPAHKLRCQQVQRHPGGGGVNVARVLHRLGAQVSALYTMGGSTGQMLAALLGEEEVPGVPVPIAGHTRESFTVAESSSAQEYRFVLPGPTLSATEWQACLDRVADQRPVPRLVVGSGSLPPGVPDDFYARLGQWARTAGAKLVVDTSGPALAKALEQGVFLVKPSLREIRDLTGRALDTMGALQRAAQDWIQAGRAEVVVVSLGEQGALLATATECVFAPPLAVTVVSAVGAGDSFVAGMVWALAAGQDVVQAFRYGVACASAALMSSGTGLCAVDDVHRLVAQVQCRPIAPEYAI